MQRVLFVLPDLDHAGAAAQLLTLLEALPEGAVEPHVFLIGRPGAWAARVKRLGVTVDAPGAGRLLELRPFIALREVVQTFAPAVVHAWRLPTIRRLAFSGFQGRIVFSPCFRAKDGRGLLGRFDRRLARRVDRAIVSGPTEAAFCQQIGIAAEKVVEIRPGVRLPGDGHLVSLDDPPTIACVGRLEPEKGFVEAVWSLDILRYIHDDLRLIIAGEGPDRERLEAFAAGVRATDAVRLPGAVDDVLPVLEQAAVVWAPGRTDTGSRVVLEAMAAGKPVVAHRWPRLAELVRDGETGFLVPPGDRSALARKTQLLLTDAELRRRMGEAARRDAGERHRPEEFARRVLDVYRG